MQNINIGKSGISVPFLGMGTWAIGGGAWWGDNDDALSVKAIQTAVEQGIQWIDTAPIYGLYHSCLLYTSPSPRDLSTSRMPSSA